VSADGCQSYYQGTYIGGVLFCGGGFGFACLICQF
jgi:hypothetical protein